MEEHHFWERNPEFFSYEQVHFENNRKLRLFLNREKYKETQGPNAPSRSKKKELKVYWEKNTLTPLKIWDSCHGTPELLF